MISELIEILKREDEALNKLLGLLDKLFTLIIEKDTFKLDAIVTEIQLCNKEVAEAEVERRKLTGKATMSNIIENASS
ncbi:flagellar export chaperone FlgN, partial [Clostridium chrysemydis]|uniref:flagellar export chaperone FlgN n=1 Tax=Clostridium chrysemydis TaxID=2665504 RepID=UPI003F377B86